MPDTTVILLLATLPLYGTGLDRDALAHRAGCKGQAKLTIVQESAEPESRWIVIVRCVVPVVPIAEILRTEPYEAPRRVRVCAPSPFAGWCFDGSKAP